MNKPLSASEIQSSTEIAPPNVNHPDSKRKGLRKKLLIGLASIVLMGGSSYYAYDVFIGSRYVTTDNAYVGAEVAQVTPMVGGPVKDVRVSDTVSVKQGDMLVILDDTDARIALEQAEAALGQAERRVRGYFASDKTFAAQVAARAADQNQASARIMAAQSDLEKTRMDLERRQVLAASGAVSREDRRCNRSDAPHRLRGIAADHARLGQGL
jgi:membrane fusion protein (multidrug efflux system)